MCIVVVFFSCYIRSLPSALLCDCRDCGCRALHPWHTGFSLNRKILPNDFMQFFKTCCYLNSYKIQLYKFRMHWEAK